MSRQQARWRARKAIKTNAELKKIIDNLEGDKTGIFITQRRLDALKPRTRKEQQQIVEAKRILDEAKQVIEDAREIVAAMYINRNKGRS